MKGLSLLPALVTLTASLVGGSLRQPNDVPLSAARGASPDSVVVAVSNTMPHPMTLSVVEKSGRRALGDIDANAMKSLVFYGAAGDSVTITAVHLQPTHEFTQVAKIGTRMTVKWEF